ncbi:hypothetical protein [Thiolapillus sp.]
MQKQRRDVVLHNNIIQIREESLAGQVGRQWELEFPKATITVRELIAGRVREEVRAYNEKAGRLFVGLVAPSDAERTLSGYHMKKYRWVDAEKQVEIAIRAFGSNGFFLLLGDRQLEELDEVIAIEGDTIVSFIKLTPIVGG